ncbi:MAG: CHASE3 domain-containing protein [Verrucomicrobiales bacterium]|nr:CHASE3 domain-containing protein [Verrucomicrobiales bacterium]
MQVRSEGATPARCRRRPALPESAQLLTSTNKPLKRKNQIYRSVVVVWLTLSLVSVVLAAATWKELSRRLEANRVMVTTARRVDELLKLMLDIETAQRGFTITGDDQFLAPMGNAEKEVPALLANLRDLARDRPRLLEEIGKLQRQVDLCMASHQEVLESRRNQGLLPAAKLVASREGLLRMDALRQQIDAIQNLSPERAEIGENDTKGQLLRAGLTSLSAGVVGIGAGVYAFWLARIMLGHKERERQLVEARLQAERSSREKSAFLANMSHEIRTPMNAILGFCELLASELKHPRQLQYLHAMRSSADSLLQLMNDILDMSKIEAGVLELRPEPTDPKEICDFLQTVFSEPASKKSIKLECHISEELPRALLIDRVRLRQVLINLVGNAVKFTDRGKVAVQVRGLNLDDRSNITLVIEVIDTGVGIPEHRLDAIFQPFVQAGTHREKETSGTGLGLSIVQRLTEKMGGSVRATSVLGQGSTFRLEFRDVPVSARASSSDPSEASPSLNFDALQPSTIMVVDDNETNRHLVQGIFAGSRHRLVLASDGRDALLKARLERPDVILLDLRMPVMDGRETLPELRKIPGMESIPIIAVTASSLLNDEQELKRMFTGYIRKPFTRQGLFEELAKFIPASPDSSGAAVVSPLPTGRPSPGNAAPELIAILEQMEREVWPEVRATGAFGESRRFAGALMELATVWHCPYLQSYGLELARHADSYALVELEQSLAAFTSVISALKGHRTS